jgi:hypothetical protein
VEKTVSKAERAWFLSHLLLFATRFWGIAEATIEDLAFGIRSSRRPDGVIKKRAQAKAKCGENREQG